MSAEVFIIPGIGVLLTGMVAAYKIGTSKIKKAMLEPVPIETVIGELKTKVKINSDKYIKLSTEVIGIKADVTETKTVVHKILTDTGAMKATVGNIMKKLNGGSHG